MFLYDLVIFKIRSLDLKADDIQIRYYWVQFLKWKLIQRRDLLLSVLINKY